MNISRHGIGYSLGPQGLHLTRKVGGGWVRNVDLPGGFSSRTTISGKHPQSAKRHTDSRHTDSHRTEAGKMQVSAELKHPGLFAARWEKDLFKALDQPDDLPQIAEQHHGERDAVLLCAVLEGLWQYEQGNNARALDRLGWAAAHGAEYVGGLGFAREYLTDRTWPVVVADGVMFALGLADDAALLVLAELHQASGDLSSAIMVVERCDPTSASALSLVELYSDAGQNQDVVNLTDEIGNEDDATALLLVLRGRAFGRLGFHDAAREVLRTALAPRSRAGEVRNRARVERAAVNLLDRKVAAARRDLESVLVADPNYPGLVGLLADLPVA